jgi:hypothetical protein
MAALAITIIGDTLILEIEEEDTMLRKIQLV